VDESSCTSSPRRQEAVLEVVKPPPPLDVTLSNSANPEPTGRGLIARKAFQPSLGTLSYQCPIGVVKTLDPSGRRIYTEEVI